MTDRRARSASGGSIRAAKRKLSRQLLHEPGVCGVGIEAADGREWIIVYLAEESLALRSLAPAEVDGYPVVIEIIGRITAHAGPRGHGAVA
jgi:hypothetical protein